MAKKSEIEQLRELCEKDFYSFARYVNPKRMYGQVHKDMMDFFSKETEKNQLALIPRSHQKSHVIATWVAWWITKHPEITILYVSATSALAEAQLTAIKQILTSDEYRFLWPEMVNKEEGKRNKWNATEIAVDHPKRREEGVRDSTVMAAGLTTNTTGFHAEVIISDDVVVPGNAYTEDGRTKVAAAMSQMASILNPGGIMKAVGTRYHPNDLYGTWKEQTYETFDSEGNVTGKESLWEIMEEVVEKNGVFLWPKETREDGKSFGFDQLELGKKFASYTDRTQFYAQYYNNPNDPGTEKIPRSLFQYYDQKFIRVINGKWHFKDEPMNVYAAIDFAFSLSTDADYTAIVVVGITPDGHIYVLDIDRFKTDRIKEYFDRIVNLHSKWEFSKLRAETTVAQKVIVRDLKEHITKSGLRLSIDEFNPNRSLGTKEERIDAALRHRYENQAMWHYKGGLTNLLEDELVMAKPPHDDIKDTLASAVEIAVAPRRSRTLREAKENVIMFNSRFGGRA